MSSTLILGRRALREALRTPDALIPTLFIPLFFLVVNVGQAARIFPSSGTEFLNGQNYAAFQLPVSLLLAASFASSALYLVEEIEGGYFDKLRAVTPIPRTAIVLGRLYAEFIKSLALSTVLILVAMLFGVRIESGPLGFVVLVVMMAFWAVVFSGFMQLVALKTRSAAATQAGSLVFFPLLFLTPNFVPRSLLTRPMEIAATLNPVTYVMEAARSLILVGFDATALYRGFLVIVLAGALMLWLSVRAMNRYD